jgi:outer membrane immunogenic protein
MTRSILAGVSLIPLFAGAVMAADLPVKAPAAKAKLSPAYNWTGCYAGYHFGSIFTQSDWGALGSDDDAGALLVGGQLGCNYQVSNWVFGLQGDAAWSDATGTHSDPSGSRLTNEWRTNSLASVTGRVGYAWDRLLSYGKVGEAWKHSKYDVGFAATSDWNNGWTVGGGFEYAVTNNVSMFFEYNYYDFGSRTVGLAAGPGVSETADIHDRSSVVKVGANYKFNW